MIQTCSEPRARRLGATLLAALALQALPIAAWAETAADIETAKAAIVEGRARLEKGDLAGARDQFKAAWALVRTPKNGVELAETHEKLRELVEARLVYVDVTKLPPRDKESKESLEAREKADARAADLQARIPTITVRLEGVPKGVEPEVSIDDASVPLAALAAPRRLNPGKHVVLVRVKGQPAKKTAFDLAEKQTRVVVVDLTADEAATKPAVAPAKPEAPSPSAKPEGSAGSVAAKGDPATAQVASPKVDGASPVEKRGMGALAWLGFGIGGVGLVVGGVTGALAAGKASIVKDNCPNQVCPPAYHADLNAAKAYSTLSNIGFAVGVVGLGVGVWGLVSGSSAEPTKAASARVQPWIGLGSAGVTGEF